MKPKCPNCGSAKLICPDGKGAVEKYGGNVMIEAVPDIWICADCGESFRAEDAYESAASSNHMQ
ncbi:MAG: hypothetical protein IJD59_02635 [Clostridia bacterium]|nr:hypothetical protein [Clostridia bacterium]